MPEPSDRLLFILPRTVGGAMASQGVWLVHGSDDLAVILADGAEYQNGDLCKAGRCAWCDRIREHRLGWLRKRVEAEHA